MSQLGVLTMITGKMMLLLTVRQSGQSGPDGIARRTLTDIYLPRIKATPISGKLAGKRQEKKNRQLDQKANKTL